MEHVKSIEGSPQPADIFQPHMPGVELMSDMDAVFDLARSEIGSGTVPIENAVKGQRAIAIVTPGRMIMQQPCPPPGSMPEAAVAPIRDDVPPDPPLRISVVSYTLVEAFMEDETKTKCIPFLGMLLSFGYIGHSVVVFEGHPTAFESGVRNSDFLIVDSGMLPFIQDDWFQVAQRVMSPAAKIFVHERETFTLMPVGKSNQAKGWQYSEYDGEASYANCLLTTLAKGKTPGVVVTSGRPLPDLSGLTTNPEDLDWIAGLPFKYNELNADKVIQVILSHAGWRWYHFFKTTGVFRASLATGKALVPVSFTLTLNKDAEGRKQLHIER